LIGVVLIFGGLAVLFASIVIAARRNQNRKIRLLLKCLIIVFLSWLVHCGLTFPFYSKYSMYPLSFILGVSMVLLNSKDIPYKVLENISTSYHAFKKREI
jgi:hypothetical protein